jgi:hypothetical protein
VIWAEDRHLHRPGQVEERELACPPCGHCWYADGQRLHLALHHRPVLPLLRNSPPRSIVWGCEPMYGVFVARHAHPCAAARGANPS